MSLRLIFAIIGFHCSYKLYGGLLDAHPAMKLSNFLWNIVFPFTRQYTRKLKDQLLESGVNLVGVGWQPLSLATVLVDDMLLCFGDIFAAQSERNKLQLLELMANKISGRKQVWRTAFMSNVCVALLGGLKV
jgi:hypothetical protein